MKNLLNLFAASCLVLLLCACDDDHRGFSSPTAPSVPAELIRSTPTPAPQQHATYPVYGVVYEVTAEGQESIEGAWVTESSEFHAGVFTAADGSYRFTGLPGGANIFNASKIGYHLTSKAITITGELRLDFELVRQ